jgi:hypothetical protein
MDRKDPMRCKEVLEPEAELVEPVGLLPQGLLLPLARLVQVVAVGKHLPKLDQVGLE